MMASIVSVVESGDVRCQRARYCQIPDQFIGPLPLSRVMLGKSRNNVPLKSGEWMSIRFHHRINPMEKNLWKPPSSRRHIEILVATNSIKEPLPSMPGKNIENLKRPHPIYRG